MAVDNKNYAAICTPLTQAVGEDSTRENLTAGSSVGCLVYFERMTPGQAFDEFGVSLRDPAVIQCEVLDAGKFDIGPDGSTVDGVGVQVLVGGRYYRVVGRPEIHDLGDECDHADVILDVAQYPVQ